ncbi:AAA family ATPase [Bacteroides fragilis]|uniref:AAA family ATPase n=1 Tax=Bacteroides fragilis TaxID=817 RepID=UPI0022AA3453|nr:AAA family ATPase [Bacteroides fragilis]MCZ2662387.1 AAA family ATPase [Bacteroides fragilis]
MEEITKHINDTNASYRHIGAGDAKNTDLFLDNEHYELFQDCGEQITVRFDKTNLTQAILFIASILPRKFDQSANHYIVNYSDVFVFDQLAILDALFKENGVSVNTFTQKWNARKDVLKKNGEIDNRFYFNNLLKEVEYKDHAGAIQITKFTIRNYFAGGFSNLNIKKASDGIFDVRIDNVTEPYNDGKEDGLEDVVSLQTESYDKISRQIIYYGAPGTGKSHKIKEILGEYEGCPADKKVPKANIFRTTFHPDSDYSTFVGAYKPTKGKRPLYGLFGKDTVRMKDGEELFEDVITYKFIPQSFLNAYICAYQTDENVYLIIEEINRGNCAQIFGDLFQLLDRDAAGKSEYSIKADADLRAFLEEELGEDNQGIKDGELCLPPNLYIYATMNTSDQSLFPIDSAFKRRWDWEYEPIKYKNTGWKIVIDGKEYSWVSFQRKVNEKILSANSSEDKMLGDYFVNPLDGVITDKVLLNKILFYLWNDVCKDGEGDIFKTSDTADISFSELYCDDSKAKLIAMMDYLGVEKYVEEDNDVGNEEEDDEYDSNGKDYTKYQINNDSGKYPKKNLAAELVKLYVEQNPDLGAQEVVNNWKNQFGQIVTHFIETQEEYDKRTDKKDRVKSVNCGEEKIYVSTRGWGGTEIIDKFIQMIPESWNLKVEKMQ